LDHESTPIKKESETCRYYINHYCEVTGSHGCIRHSGYKACVIEQQSVNKIPTRSQYLELMEGGAV